MGPIYSLDYLPYASSFETLTLIQEVDDLPTAREVVFIGMQENGGIAVLEEGKGFIEISKDSRTRFIYGGGHSKREVLERYNREMEMERRAKELTKQREDRGRKVEIDVGRSRSF